MTGTRRAAVLQGIAEELDRREVIHNAHVKNLSGERVQVLIRMPGWLRDDLRVLAERSGLSVNEIITFAAWTMLYGDSSGHTP